MCLHRSLIAAALGVAAIVSSSAHAQSAPPRPGSIDVREFMPGLHADHGAPANRSRGGLTTEARIETALRDRDVGALRSAGEAADVHTPRPARTLLAPPAVAASAATPSVATTASAAPL